MCQLVELVDMLRNDSITAVLLLLQALSILHLLFLDLLEELIILSLNYELYLMLHPLVLLLDYFLLLTPEPCDTLTLTRLLVYQLL